MAYTRPAAPGALEEIETFCNSARFLYDEDAFAELASTRTWLRNHGWREAAAGLAETARRELVTVREAIRDHLEGEVATQDVLNDYARSVLDPPQWTEAGAVLPVREKSGIRVLIGQLIALLMTEEIAGRLLRLKVCHAPECRWVFYDRSPANNSVWCSMSICGARHKMRTYRSRSLGE